MFRSVLMFFITLVAVRITGKRSIGQLAPFDLVVIIIMGSAAALPLEEEDIDLVHGITPIVVMAALQYILSVINMHWRAAEKVTQGMSTPVVVNGVVMQENLKKERISEADLHIILRQAGADKVEDLALAVMEPTGQLSIVKKQEAQPITAKDMNAVTVSRIDTVRGQLRQRRMDKFRDVVNSLPKRIYSAPKRNLL